MALYREDIVNIDLENGTLFRSFMNHQIGEGDSGANRFGVRVFRGGEEVSVSGATCTGYFIRPEGDTVVITGTASGNTAYVDLPQACYAYEGQFSLAIKLAGGNVTGTMRIVDGVVTNTTTDTLIDPGTVIPSVEDLISAIEAAVSSIPADYSGLWETLAPDFSTSATYSAGDLVTYDGGMYQFIVPHTGTWNADDVTAVTVNEKITDIENALYQAEKNVKDPEIFSELRFDVIPGKYVNSVNGTIYTSSDSSGVTNFIDVQSYDFIRFKARVSSNYNRQSGIAFYDRSKKYISGEKDLYGAGTDPHYYDGLNVVAVPENAVFVCCSTYADTETYGVFKIFGHNKTGEAIIGSQNAVTDANNVLFKRVTASTDLQWELGGFYIKDGSVKEDNAYVRCRAINVCAGSSIDVAEGYKFMAVMRQEEEVGNSHPLIFVKPETVSGRFVVPQDCILRLAIATNAETTQTGTGIESNFILNLYKKEKNVPSMDEFNDAVRYAIDTSEFSWAFGGLNVNGTSSTSNTRIRLLNEDGKGGIAVGKDSVITANDGYKFNVFLYSEYISNSNFVLIGHRTMGTGSYTVPQDCFIRVSVGTTNDDVLWETGSDGVRTFTEAGEAAKSGLVLNLIGGGVKEEIAKVDAKISTDSIWESPIALEDSIPLNAVAFHALFDDLVTDGKLSRELLGKVNNDNSLPIYLYKLQNDMDFLNSSYAKVAWNGSNQLYNRPKIFLDSGIHGNERTTPFALYDFIRKLCTDISYQHMRNAFEWFFIPLANPWGFSHSAITISTGAVSAGGDYTTEHMSLYTVVDNTSSVHQGIRQTYTGKDINRDFGTFATEEAQIIKNALDDMTEDERKFAFAIDSHQAAKGDYVNAIGAFVSMNYGAEESQKSLVWKKFMQAGAITEQVMAEACDMPVTQSIFPWDGTNLATLRNYFVTYADFGMCFEGGQNCAYYSRTTEWSNTVARTFVNTQYQGFLHLLTDYWM